MSFRHQYVIGDLQGCYAAYLHLLETLDFDPTQDKLWFAGDLVARGEDSLNTLRHVKALCEQGAAATVLGNHDINLIAVWRGAAKIKKKTRPHQFLLPMIVMSYYIGYVSSRYWLILMPIPCWYMLASRRIGPLKQQRTMPSS